MKIKCKDCVNEGGRRCNVKNVTINPGKSRKCGQFEFDSVRELVRLKHVKAIRKRHEARQAAYREFLAGQKTNKGADKDTKHPVTGNLDRFKTG